MAALERVISLHDRQMAVTPVPLLLAMRERGEDDLVGFLRSSSARTLVTVG
jgi:hypothetical protein